MRALALSFIALLVALSAPLLAQDKGTLDPKPLPPLAHPEDPAIPAKELFGRKTAPASLEARAIGFYAHGCLAGAKVLPVDGEAWQVMRLSRNRNWGHPALIDFLERFAKKIPKVNGWPGILVGDISQPRGGPMLTGHASHQVGLDADIWLTPMPNRKLSREEREEMSATNVVRDDGLDVNKDWTPKHIEAIKAAAQDPAVQRIFVNAAIKKAICREAKGDRTWLEKVRPMYGHNYHFHVRMRCPSGDNACQDQAPVPGGEGCDKGSLAYWFRPSVLHPKRDANAKPRRGPTMAALPAECRRVLVAK
ncbi:MAG TPA: penicillin-insensitive murein endopeptidase [Beijerinckiaceae bacterium]|jgi:penicillin-insensitive murein endopeptidase|nr:penicillin-insensitive murein endopeptidase [Beijerinckiaceae bacterium]